MIRAGNLDRRIRIERPLTTVNSYGEPVESWVEFKTVWAEVKPVRGAERFEAMARRATRFEVFRIRHLEGVTPTMRIVWEERNYQIRNIGQIGRREGLEIFAESEE